jgi:hypothetical protein
MQYKKVLKRDEISLQLKILYYYKLCDLHTLARSVRTVKLILCGVTVSVLATGTKVHRFKPGQGQWIFEGDKNLKHTFLHRGSKVISPMS